MQALYEADHSGNPIAESLKYIFENDEPNAEDRDFIEELAIGAWGNKEKSDAIIKEFSIGWDVSRIGGVDRNILRLAIYEMDLKKTPPQVIINEAIELAKKYSTKEASKFINGVLGAYLKVTKK